MPERTRNLHEPPPNRRAPRRGVSLAALGALLVGVAGTACGVAAQPDGPEPTGRPALFVIVTVDQMRHDYIERYAETWSGGLRRLVDEGAVFAEAAASGDARMQRVCFDISNVVFAGMPGETKARLVARLRQVGLDRVLFAVDGPVSREPWERLRSLPLDAGELTTIAGNLAPWLREPGATRSSGTGSTRRGSGGQQE